MTHCILRWLATMMIVFGCGLALAQSNPPPPDETLEHALSLLREMSSATDSEAWLAQRRTVFTPKLADVVDRIAEEAIKAKRGEVAVPALELAALMHQYLQQPEAALRSVWMRLEVLFFLANTADQYASVRSEAKWLAGEAGRIDHLDVAFRSAVLSAEAAIYGSRAKDVPVGRKAHPLAALTDLKVAFELMPRQPERIWFERTVSSVATVLAEPGSRDFDDSEAITAATRLLAPLIERLVPIDFAYTVAEVGNAVKTVDTARKLAVLSYRHGVAAVGSARLALASQRAVALGDLEREIRLVLAHYELERGTDAAPALLRQLSDTAWQRIKDLRSSYRSGSGRIWAAQRSDALLGGMLQIELEDSKVPIAEIFSRIESVKARLLLDRLASPDARELRSPQTMSLEHQVLAFKKNDKADADIMLQEMQLVSRLSGLEGFSEDDNARARAGALASLEQVYRGTTAGYGAAADSVSLTALQQTLAADEALIEYVIPPHDRHPAQNLWILLVTRRNAQLAHVSLDKELGVLSDTGRLAVDGQAPMDASALGDLIMNTRIYVRSSDDKQARVQLALLHRLLIEPLIARGFRPEDYKRLLIVPHGVLHTVPFAALLDASGKFLVAKTEVVVTPSASVWHRLVQRRAEAATALVLANPLLGSRGIADLPFAAQEGEAVKKALAPRTVRMLPGREATLARLLAEAPDAGIMHLATHGEFPNESAASEHALWLTDEEGRGVTLPAARVRLLRLRASRLVVLSVCNGGLYRIGPSDEPYGLVPAFIEAGTANVLGTQWPLDDQFGRDFMAEYYRYLPKHGVAGALRKASLHFIGENEFLRKWAAFVLVGAGR